jgi:hypothetical protein
LPSDSTIGTHIGSSAETRSPGHTYTQHYRHRQPAHAPHTYTFCCVVCLVFGDRCSHFMNMYTYRAATVRRLHEYAFGAKFYAPTHVLDQNYTERRSIVRQCIRSVHCRLLAACDDSANRPHSCTPACDTGARVSPEYNTLAMCVCALFRWRVCSRWRTPLTRRNQLLTPQCGLMLEGRLVREM